jgi:hypothetical protein
MTWIPDDPAHAEAVSGLYPQVGTGYSVSEGEPAEVTESKKTTYAKVAPVGRAVVIRIG